MQGREPRDQTRSRSQKIGFKSRVYNFKAKVLWSLKYRLLLVAGQPIGAVGAAATTK